MQTLSVEQLVGQTFDNYRVERFIGKGRLNAVYLARNLSSQRLDALTLYPIPEHFSSDARTRFITRFRHYASTVATLSHPHVLPVYAYGEMFGNPYLVTPYQTNGSLSDRLKHDGRYDYLTVLSLIEHVAPGLQYAHEEGIVHGTVRPSLIVFSEEGTLQVAGFGLFHMLQLSGIEETNQPYAHLLSIAGTMLAPPEYVAPEVIQGQPVDVRADVYALGCLVFELLSGQPPFAGTNLVVSVSQRETQDFPSLRLLCPDIPLGVVSVVNQALHRDPDQRFQQVSELVEAFAQISRGITNANQPTQAPALKMYGMENEALQKTQHQEYVAKKWQLLPPIITNKIPTVRSHVSEAEAFLANEPTTRNTDKMAHPPISRQQFGEEKLPGNPLASTQLPTSAGLAASQTSMPGKQNNTSSLMKAYEWRPQPGTPPSQASQPEKKLMATSQHQQAQEAADLTSSTDMDWATDAFMTAPLSNKRTRSSGNGSRKVSRRRVVATLVTGGVAVVGTAAYVGLKPLFGSAPSQTTTMNGMSNKAPGKAQMSGMTMGNAQSPANNQHMPGMNMGTLVGKTDQAINTAQPFTNPADGKASLLIHLPDGKFVAYERACTHVGVNVNYDPGSQKLVCPAHGAIFDPANGAKVLQGPATRPLTPVTVRVNGDGMITVS